MLSSTLSFLFFFLGTQICQWGSSFTHFVLQTARQNVEKSEITLLLLNIGPDKEYILDIVIIIDYFLQPLSTCPCVVALVPRHLPYQWSMYHEYTIKYQ